MFALTNLPTTVKRAGAERDYVSGAGELLFLVLAITLLRHLLGRFKRVLDTTSGSPGRRLATHNAHGHSRAYSRRSTSKPPPPDARQQTRRATAKAAKRPAAVPSIKIRRPVDAREALRRSCAAMGEAPETDVR